MRVTVRAWLCKRFEIFRSAYSSWTATIGTIIGTIALCNLIFRAIDVPLIESLSWLLSAYQKTFHPPIDYLLSVFSLRLPSFAKDLLVLYLAGAGIVYRTVSYTRPSPLKERFPTTLQTKIRDLRMLTSKIIMTLFWPYFISSFIRHPCLLITSEHGYHGRLPPPRSDLSPARRDEVIRWFLAEMGKEARVICDERQLLASYAIGLVAAVVALVVVNAAIDGLS